MSNYRLILIDLNVFGKLTPRFYYNILEQCTWDGNEN